MELLQGQLNQIQSDIVWMAKGFFYFGKVGDTPSFVEHPTMEQINKALGLTNEQIISELASIVAQAIMEEPDPIQAFKDMIYFASVSLKTKMESISFEMMPVKGIQPYVNNHIVSYMLVVLAKWEIPENIILLPPSWDPDIFKKKRKK